MTSILKGAVLPSAVFMSMSGPAVADNLILSLTAAPQTQIIHAGEKAVITVTQTNLSDIDILEMTTNPDVGAAEYNYDIHIKDESGMSPQLTDYGKSFLGGSYDTGKDNHSMTMNSNRGVYIAKGHSHSDSMDLSSIYSLTRGHTYNVYLIWSRKVIIFSTFNKQGKSELQNHALNSPLQSNTIQIMVE